MQLFIKLEVGKPFPYKTMKNDGVMFDYRENGFEFLLGMNNVSSREVKAFKNGKVQIDLALINGIIFMIFEIDGLIGLSDAPFHIALSKTPLSSLELDDNGCYSLLMYLIDTVNNELRAMRLVSLDNDFSKILKIAIDEQLRKSFDNDEYVKDLGEVIHKLTPDNLKQMSTVHFSTK